MAGATGATCGWRGMEAAVKTYSPWSPYTGGGSIVLTVVLLVVTGALVYGGVRLRHPLVATRPGRFLGACILVAWCLAVAAFLVAFSVYVLALRAQLGQFTGPANPITPVSALAGIGAILVILFLTIPSATSPITTRQFLTGVGSGVMGAIAALMIFELPYDLIVIGRTHPPAPAALYALLFFLPLFLIEILSFALLTLSPFTNVSRTTLFLLAGMFFVFAVWAAFGFGYPSTPVPFALNSLAKVIAFATAASLFLPRQRAAKAGMDAPALLP